MVEIKFDKWPQYDTFNGQALKGLMEYRTYQPSDPVNLKGAVVVSPGISGKIDYIEDNLNADAPAMALAEFGFKAVIFSPPGHGGSTIPFSIDNYAWFSSCWRDRLHGERFERVNGFGHSFGAYALAVSATKTEYSALSLLGAPLSVKEVFQNMEPMGPIALKMYEAAKGKPWFEEIVARLILAGMNYRYSRKDTFAKRMGALEIKSARLFMNEMAESPKLDDILEGVPKATRTMATYLTRDGHIYKALSPEIKQELIRRWQRMKPEAVLRFDDGTHTYSKDLKWIFNEPEFHTLMEETARFFLQ